jgi:hypothetical protein
MNKRELVAVLRQVVFDAAVDGTFASLNNPPGRQPPPTFLSAADWYGHLSPEDRQFVRFVARHAAHSVLFGMLAVLDGVRVVDQPPHGELVLTYRFADGQETRLNGHDGDELHDLLNALVHPAHEPLEAD